MTSTLLAQASVRAALFAQTPAPAVAAAADYGFFSAILHAGLGEKVIMGILLFFSIVSWGIIAHKLRTLHRAVSQSETFLETFWNTKRLDAIFEKAEVLPDSPVSQVFRAGYIELAKIRKVKDELAANTQGGGGAAGELESVERSMRRAAASELTQLESLVPFLATTGSTAPFIGLLGTVIGIINSFRDIGMMGNANLATVAPGIGGALVATAFGLFAAIPAVMAYNYFLTRIRVLETEMQNFSADFLNIVKRHFF
jgi:biopolymer transport protein TolQ